MFALGFGQAALPAQHKIANTAPPPPPPPPPPAISAIAPDGWTATMAAPVNLSLTPVAASDAGFDATGAATTHVRTVHTTQRIYNPFPDQNTLTADKVALSDVLYATSAVAGLDTSACPASPKPVMQWRLPDGFVVGNTIRQRVAAFHRDGIACIKAWASDGTNASPVVTVSALATDREAGDRWFANEYEVMVDISGLADSASGALITLHCEGYPRLGGTSSIRSTSDSSEPQRFSPRSYYRSTSRAAAPFVVAVSAGGNDTTGAVSQNQASAYAAPCATPRGALMRLIAVLGAGAGSNGAEVHLDAGTWDLSSLPTTNTNIAFVTIRPKDGVSKANCIWTFGAATGVHPRLARVRYQGLTMLRPATGAQSLLNTAGGHALIEGCDLDCNGNATALVSGTGAMVSFTGGCTITNGAGTLNASSSQIVRLMRGTTIVNASAVPIQVEMYNAVACEFENVASNNSANRNLSGAMITACRFRKLQSTGSLLNIGSGGAVDGFALVNLELEYTGTGNASAANIAADGVGTNHAIVLNCTGVGYSDYGRWLAFYNEAAGLIVSHTMMRVAGNIVTQLNTKHDVFAGVNKGLADASQRTGGWSFLYGVGCQGNFTLYADSSGTSGRGSFAQLYAGAGSDIGASATVKNNPLFIDPRHTEGGPLAGAGGSNLRVQAGSGARGIVSVGAWTPKYDLDGVVRNGGAFCAAGAYA